MTDGATALRALTRVVGSIAVELPDGVPDAAAAAARLEHGIPGLTGEPLLDWDSLLRAASLITAELAAAGVAIAPVAPALATASARIRPEQILEAALSGATSDLPWEHPGAEALSTVLDWAARPALRAAARSLGGLLPGTWSRGRCPGCGAPPTLSVVSGKERTRRLHCGRCLTSWPYPRVRCPGCGEHRHERLGYLHAPGEADHRRAEVCDSCGTYVKSVAQLDPPGADRLVDLDLETVALDFAALDGGYARV